VNSLVVQRLSDLQEVDELVNLIVAHAVRNPSRLYPDVGQVDVVCVWVVTHDFGEGGDNRGELEVVGGLAERRKHVTQIDVFVDFDDLTAGRVFPAQEHFADVTTIVQTHAPVKRDFIHGGYLVAGTELASVDVVVAEVAVTNATVLEANQAVLVDDIGVELDLDLGVDCGGDQRRSQFLFEQALGFVFGASCSIMVSLKLPMP